jgi:hypothetical protein
VRERSRPRSPGSRFPFGAGVRLAVSDGYWSYVDPLPAGAHVVEFGGTTTDGFTVNVTYHLTVQ